ncbi:MAG: hypothetical protein ACE5KI_01725, partial [Dehalococcoidia bacterium]
FNEVVIALWLKTPFFRTPPMNLWSGVTAEFAPMMSAVSVLLLFVVAVVFLIAVYFRRRLAREM